MSKISELASTGSSSFSKGMKKDRSMMQTLKRREQARNTAREANEFANLVMSFVRGSNTFE
ncbi:hypothetical protein phiV208_68 [Vibrio phage phiV208]|nr:hypothetical protein phiV208_68 [Vibrio phage phiV208]